MEPQAQSIPPPVDYSMHLGGLTDYASRYLGINLAQGKSPEEQFDYGVSNILSLEGFKRDCDAVVEGQSLRVFGSYKGQPLSILLMRTSGFVLKEWLLRVSSKHGLQQSELEDLADEIEFKIAKPPEDRKYDAHQARIEAGY